MKPTVEQLYKDRPEGCKSISVYQHERRYRSWIVRLVAGTFTVPEGLKGTYDFTLELYNNGNVNLITHKKGGGHGIFKIDAEHIRYNYDCDSE